MLQKDSLLEWKNIFDNVLFGLEIGHKKTKENEQYVIELLKKYGLYEFKDKYPNQLSRRYETKSCINKNIGNKT